jgi:hypothetical protein
MKKTVFSLAALTALIIAGCSKDDDKGGPEKDILGKWTRVSTKVVLSDKVQGTSKTMYPTIYPGDYLDFRGDGKVYTYETDPNGGTGYNPHDTLLYKFSNPYLIIDGDTMSIGALTKDSLVLELHEGTSTQDWFTTFKLKK